MTLIKTVATLSLSSGPARRHGHAPGPLQAQGGEASDPHMILVTFPDFPARERGLERALPGRHRRHYRKDRDSAETLTLNLR